MKIVDNYQEVLMFRSEDKELTRYICEMIWRHNLEEHHEIVMVFFPRVMDRVSAAIHIQ